MESWQVAVVALLALLAGAAIPVLVQVAGTTRTLRETAARLGARGEEAFVAVTAASRRLERLAARFEDERHAELLLQGLDSLSRTAVQVGEATRVASALGAAIGPAIAAAVRAWRGPLDGATAPEAAGKPKTDNDDDERMPS